MLEPSLPHYKPDTVGVFVIETIPFLVRDPDGSLGPGTKEDLVVGRRVRTYYAGFMLRSLSPGVSATGGEIIRHL